MVGAGNEARRATETERGREREDGGRWRRASSESSRRRSGRRVYARAPAPAPAVCVLYFPTYWLHSARASDTRRTARSVSGGGAGGGGGALRAAFIYFVYQLQACDKAARSRESVNGESAARGRDVAGAGRPGGLGAHLGRHLLGAPGRPVRQHRYVSFHLSPPTSVIFSGERERGTDF